MNGRIIPAQAAAPPAGPGFGFDDRAAVTLRLLFALVLSCLLHAAVVFLPLLGMSTRAGRLAAEARKVSPPVLEAQLVPAGEREQRGPDAGIMSAAELRAQQPAADTISSAPNQPVAPQPAAGIDLLPLAAPVYYTTDQLSKRPQPLAAAELDTPQLRAIVASGKIVLTLRINEFGAVVDVTVEKSELPEAFSRSAAAAFKAMRFTPGERNGQPVATIMRIEVDYDDNRLKSD